MAGPDRLTVLSRGVLGAFHPPPGPLVVALSGGADSAVCAWAAAETTTQVRALHVHHRLPASDRMAAAAEAVAARLGLPLEVLFVDLPPGASPEGRARSARYQRLLAALASDEWLLTGHTADDQAETVLAHLLRGSGLDGLAGIPARRAPVARPLLAVSRAHTRELATLLGLPWEDDPANAEPHPLRNRIRSQLIPLLEEGFNPALRSTLARVAAVAADEAAHLEKAAAGLRIEVGEGRARLVAAELVTAPAAVAARGVRRALRVLRGPYGGSRREVEAVLKVARGEVAAARLGGDLAVDRQGPWVVVALPRPPEAPPAALALAVPGIARWGRWRIEVQVDEHVPPVPLSPWRLVAPHHPDLPLVVRPPRRGDRLATGSGSKEVRRALAEGGIPLGERAAWPVVEAGGEVVWIPGVRRAPGWPRPESGRYLSASVEEETEWTT